MVIHGMVNYHMVGMGLHVLVLIVEHVIMFPDWMLYQVVFLEYVELLGLDGMELKQLEVIMVQ
jgi:hypothetical protein